MISYVLIMMVSLATGQPVHASLEGPMSQSWCTQLIQRPGYQSQDGQTRKSSSCMSWPDAQRILTASFCTQRLELHGEQASDFDCAPPAPPPQSAQGPAPPAAAGELPAAPAGAPGQPFGPPAAAAPAQPFGPPAPATAAAQPFGPPAPAAAARQAPASRALLASGQTSDPEEADDSAGSAAMAYPDTAAVATPVPARGQEADSSSGAYAGILIRDRDIIVAPRIFGAADCPRALNTSAARGHNLYLRCLSVEQTEQLLGRARCHSARANGSGSWRYTCRDDPTRYLDDLSQR